MQGSTPLTLIYDAFLRPTRAIALLESGQRAIWLAGLITLGFLIATFAGISVTLNRIVMIPEQALLAGSLFAPIVAMLYAGLAVPILGASRPIMVGLGFSLMRCQIAIAPPAALLLSLTFGAAYQDGRGAYDLNLLLPAMFGAWLAGLIIVMLALRHPLQSATLRWMLAGGGAIVGALLWWSPVLRSQGSVAMALFCAGLSAGMLRPISYLFEAFLDRGLQLAAWIGVPAARLLPLHPAMYNELGLLPLPGLYRLLLRTCATDPTVGGCWVLRLAWHPRHEIAAMRAIDQIIHEGRYTHPLLFWLSTHPEGVAFLRRMVEETARPHPIIVAYTAFAHVESPEAWLTTIIQQRSAIAASAPLHGGETLLHLLDAAAGALRASRWSEAVAHLQMSDHLRSEEPAAQERALAIMRSWADPGLLLLDGSQERSIRRKDSATLPEWLAALLSAVGEHLSFLLAIEQRHNDLLPPPMQRSELPDAPDGSMVHPAQPAPHRLEHRSRPTSMARAKILHIYITRLSFEENAYQFTLYQPGIGEIRGPNRMEAIVSTSEVQEIRSHYEQKIHVFHDLTARGLPVAPPDEEELVMLGRRIAELLPPLAHRTIIDVVQRAQRQRHDLRVLLEVAADARTLLEVPWELLLLPLARGPHTDTGEGFLLLNAGISLIRQLHGAGHNTEPDLALPFTSQVIAAVPVDGPEIELESTRVALVEGLMVADLGSSWYAGTDTLGILQERLRSQNPDILHLLCHGEQSDTGRGVRSDLLFVHRDGYIQRVNAFDLAPLMTLAPNLQIVVLQACHAGLSAAWTKGMEVGERLSIESIALALVRHGIPAVIAMQGEVRQDAANAFVRALYAALKQGQSLDKAVAAGRIAMRAVGGIVDWSLPVLYQGSGRPEPSTWYTRFADRVDAALNDPSALRAMRGLLIAWALALLITAVMQSLLLLPTPPSVTAAILVRPLLAWIAAGVVGPAIIAVTHRSIRYYPKASASQRRVARNAQWIGAYLGYTLSGIVGLAVLATLWVFGFIGLLPYPWPQFCFGSIVVASLMFSYVIARSQVRSALAIAVVDTSLFDLRSVGIVLISMVILLLAPLLPLLIPDIAAVLLHPTVAALALAMFVITLVVLSGGGHQAR